MDSGTCLGCGLGINTPLQTDNSQSVTWQSGKPNPLPIFEKPDEFYTSLIIPGPYLPVELIAPLYVLDGIPYHPLPDIDVVNSLIAFAAHEGVHITQMLGIIPTTMRLAATCFYNMLVSSLSQDFDSDIWYLLNSLNDHINVIGNATGPMHEAAAIVENLSTTFLNNPYIHGLSEKSVKNYEKKYGDDFIWHLGTFDLLINTLKNHFAPTPLKKNTIIALADYIISSAIDLQELATVVLQVPLPIADTSLRNYMKKLGIPYLEFDKNRSLESCPMIHGGFGGFTVYGTAARLSRTIDAMLSAKVKRPRKMPENYIDQLLYIAKVVPELKLWLKSLDARHWLKRRMMNIISDYQQHLRQSGVFLPLLGVWESDISAFMAMQTSFDGETLDIIRCGSMPENFIETAVNIPDNFWLAYDIQKDSPLGVMYRPFCIDGIPIGPSVLIIATSPHEDKLFFMGNLIFFESMRLQLAAGCGLVCPFEKRAGNCCGRAGLLWQVYNLGQTAMDKADWRTSRWDAPECKKVKNNRIRRGKSPKARTSSDNHVFL